MSLYENDMPTEGRQEVVVLQKVLADRANQGYHDFENLVIERVDGQPVRSLRHLVGLVSESEGPYVSFVSSCGARIVLETGAASERHQQVLGKFGVPQDRSDDLCSR
jgi:hypothetical protein